MVIEKLHGKRIFAHVMSTYLFYIAVLNEIKNPKKVQQVPEDIRDPYFDVVQEHEKVQSYFINLLNSALLVYDEHVEDKNLLWKELGTARANAIQTNFISLGSWKFDEPERMEIRRSILGGLRNNSLHVTFSEQDEEPRDLIYQEVIDICTPYGKLFTRAPYDESTSATHGEHENGVRAIERAINILAEFYKKIGAWSDTSQTPNTTSVLGE